MVIFGGIALKLFQSMSILAIGSNSPQETWLNIVLNNKPYHYFLISIDAKTLLSFLKIERRKSLRQVAMVAKFLDDKKLKRHLKSGFALSVRLHRSSLISFNLSNVGKIFWVESARTVSKFRKRKR